MRSGTCRTCGRTRPAGRTADARCVVSDERKVSPIEALPDASRAYGEIGSTSEQPKWGMAVDLERCIGCWSCAVICKSENDVPLGMWWNRILTEGDQLDTPTKGEFGE